MDDPVKSDNRWVSEEWRSFELYEKVRIRTRRSKFLLIFSATVLFLGLCSVPVIEERSPKWQSLRIARDLSVEIEKIKTLAIKSKKPVRLFFISPNLLEVDLLSHCTDVKGQPVVTKQWTGDDVKFKILSQDEAKEFSIALVGDAVCFDPVEGLISKHSKQVIAIIPVKDLSEKRLDRASYVIIEGESAKVSIN